MKQQIRRADDGNIDKLHGTAETQSEVLVEPYHDNVGSAGRAVMAEHQAQSCAAEHAPYEHVHELVLAYGDDGVSLEEGLHGAYEHRHDGYAHDGTYGKLPVQRAKGYAKQKEVERPDGDGWRHLDGIEEQGRDTRHATHDHVLGQHKGRETYGIKRYAKRDEQ